MGLRDVDKEGPKKGEGLFRTLSMALIIAGIISFAAMFYALFQNRPEAAGASYYLPWCLPYGIVNLLMAAMGTAFTTLSKEKPSLYKPGAIAGIVSGGLLIAQSVPIVIWLSNVEFFISVAVIGACVIAIGILTLSSLKEDA
ncbi:MAG: hypothetical protein K6E59_01480 [Bacilli bacterium]|nr:hypothetical protein [Bacilli bacterium]